MGGAALQINAWPLILPASTHPLTPIEEVLGRRLIEWPKLEGDKSKTLRWELPPGRTRNFHLGRLEASEICLPSFRVRKIHAEIEFVTPGRWLFIGRAPAIWDVNGCQVERRSLLGKTQMLLGDHIVEFLTGGFLRDRTP